MIRAPIGWPGSVAACLLLAGCASNNPYSVPATPNTATGCVSSMAALHVTVVPAETMDNGRPVVPPYIDFADVSQCLHLPSTAPEAVALYAIGTRRPIEMKFRLLLSPKGTMPATVSLLDGQFRVVRAYDFSSFTRRGGEYSLPVFLNPTDSNIRYALVTPDPHYVGKDEQTHGSVGGPVSVPGPGYFFLIYVGHETDTKYPFTLGGRISVSTTTEVSAPIVSPQ